MQFNHANKFSSLYVIEILFMLEPKRRGSSFMVGGILPDSTHTNKYEGDGISQRKYDFRKLERK
jgi:hypothetical protein